MESRRKNCIFFKNRIFKPIRKIPPFPHTLSGLAEMDAMEKETEMTETEMKEMREVIRARKQHYRRQTLYKLNQKRVENEKYMYRKLTDQDNFDETGTLILSTTGNHPPYFDPSMACQASRKWGFICKLQTDCTGDFGRPCHTTISVTPPCYDFNARNRENSFPWR